MFTLFCLSSVVCTYFSSVFIKKYLILQELIDFSLPICLLGVQRRPQWHWDQLRRRARHAQRRPQDFFSYYQRRKRHQRPLCCRQNQSAEPQQLVTQRLKLWAPPPAVRPSQRLKRAFIRLMTFLWRARAHSQTHTQTHTCPITHYTDSECAHRFICWWTDDGFADTDNLLTGDL